MPKHIQDDTYVAVATIPIYRAVVIGTGDTGCAMPGGAGVVILGISQDSVVGTAASPKNVRVRSRGTSKATAAAAITRGDLLSVSAATGLLKTAAVGEHVVGRAVTAAGALNDVFDVDLDHFDYISL